jgi:hypothetical protein
MPSLLADVYINMTRGQDALLMEIEDKSDTKNRAERYRYAISKSHR